jgi:O-antigen ligase
VRAAVDPAELGSPGRAAPHVVPSSSAILGFSLVVALIGWIGVMTLLLDGTVDMLLIVAAAFASFCAASLVTRRNPWVVPALVVVSAAAFAGIRADVLLGSPQRAPLGYSNAAGSLYMFASAAAALLAVRVRQPGLRAGAVLLVFVFALVPFGNGTRTAAVLLCGLPAALIAVAQGRARAVVVAAVGMVAIVATCVGVLALRYDAERPRNGLVDRAVDATLSERRVELWADAAQLAFRHPVTGIGPGRFPAMSRAAQKDADTTQPHNEFLHLAAEAGIPALLLFVGLIGWLAVRLGNTADQHAAAIGAFVVAAAAVHGSVDYIFHFPAVTVAAAAILAAAMGGGRRRGSSAGAQRLRRRTSAP